MNDQYATPQWIKLLFEDWYDPCLLSNGELRKYDGISTWQNKTFVNPPYSNPLPWVKNAITEMKKGKLIVMLLRCDSSTEYFRLCIEFGEIIYFGRRIKFNGNSPNFPSMLVIFNGVSE